jgi:hypothetical protein
MSDPIRDTLAMFCVALSEATTLATDKPVGRLSGNLMREMAIGASAETAELCAFIANCVDPPIAVN